MSEIHVYIDARRNLFTLCIKQEISLQRSDIELVRPTTIGIFIVSIVSRRNYEAKILTIMNEFEILAELIGIPDLKTQNRNQVNSTARQAIAYLLYKDGYSPAEIGVMQGRKRTTIIHQIKTFRQFLDCEDEMALEFWEKLNSDCQ